MPSLALTAAKMHFDAAPLNAWRRVDNNNALRQPRGPMAQVHSVAMDALDDDAALAARVRAGDGAAFETLFREYFARLASLAYSYVRSREIAEELVQDTLLSIWKGRAAWDVEGHVRQYLYAAVRHRAISHLRKVKVATRVEDEATSASMHGIGWGGAFGSPSWVRRSRWGSDARRWSASARCRGLRGCGMAIAPSVGSRRGRLPGSLGTH